MKTVEFKDVRPATDGVNSVRHSKFFLNLQPGYEKVYSQVGVDALVWALLVVDEKGEAQQASVKVMFANGDIEYTTTTRPRTSRG